MNLAKYFWRFLKPDRGVLFLSFIGLSAQSAFSVLLTMVPTILERNWHPGARPKLFYAIGGLLAVNLVILAVQMTVNWMMTKVTENVVRRVKLAIFKKVGNLPSEEMTFESVGKFAQRTTGDVMHLGGMVSPGILQLMFSSTQLVFMMGALFWIDYRFAWIIPLVAFLVAAIVRWVNEKVRFWSHKDQMKQEDILTQFIESIGGCRDLIASGRFNQAAEAYDVELARKQKFQIAASWWNNMGGILPTACFSCLIFGYYLFKISQSDFTDAHDVGIILSYAGNLAMAQGLALTLFKLTTDAALATPSLTELKNLLEAPEVADSQDHTVLASSEIAFNDVHFGYGGGGGDASKTKTILSNLTFRVDPGIFAAIVGQSGSGKTTLFYMLLRLLEPQSGCITLGGVELHKIPLSVLHDYIGFIPQAPFIFSGSIKQNLLMGANPDDFPPEKIDHAVKLARLEDLIAKRKDEGGLDAPVGAGGASLSAGERQRIALGRIFLRNPSIIVCDEYTANIDNATAKLIQNALKNEFAGKTRVVITHQLYTIRGADRIYVIDKGSIVEQGTHLELVSKEDGLYRETWDVQRVE